MKVQKSLKAEGKPEERKSALFLLDVGHPEYAGSNSGKFLAILPDSKLLADIATLAEHLQTNKTAQAIVVYDSAQTVLCRSLQQGTDPATVLKVWVEQMHQHLQPMLRSSRRRIALIESSALKVNPANMLEEASRHLNRSLPTTDFTAQVDAQDPIHQLIANEILANSKNAAALDEFLEAQALMFERPNKTERADRAVRIYTELSAAFNKEKNIGLERQVELQQNGQQLTEQNNKNTQTAAQLKNRVELQQVQLNFMQNDLETQQDTAAKLKTAQQVKKNRELTIGDLRAKLAEKEILLAEKNTQLESLVTSTSWRITAPIRRVKMSLSRRPYGPKADQPECLKQDSLKKDDHTVLHSAAVTSTTKKDHSFAAKSPKISVITVVFQDPEGLERTIESVKLQRYANFEYVIIDGASKDRTAEVLKAHKDIINVLVSEPDRGIYDAMNKGIRAAKGEYIVFMNAGDSFVDEKTIENVAIELTGEDVVYGDRYYLRKSGPVLQRSHEIDCVKYRMPYCHQSAYYKRETLEKYPFNPTYRYAADYNQLVEIYLAKCRFKKIDKVLCNFVPGGASESGIRPYLDVLKIQFDNFGGGEEMIKSKYMRGFVDNISDLLKPYGYTNNKIDN